MGVYAQVRFALAGVIWHILNVVLKWSADAEVDKAFAKLKAASASASASIAARNERRAAILLRRI
jgi:hypothetical protein